MVSGNGGGDELDAMLHRIRSEGHVRPPVVKCPRCGHVGEGAEPHVTVRAMILSLVRFGIAPAEPVNTLEKGWAAYRKQNWRLASIRVQIQAAGRYLGCMQQAQRTQFDRQASCERKSKRSDRKSTRLTPVT